MTEFYPASLPESLLESMPDMVYVVDLDGRLRWWNERVAEVTGYGDDELDGMDVFEMVDPSERSAARDAFEQIETFSSAFTLEFTIRTADGRRLPYEFNGSTLDVDGETVVVTIARDVVSRRERDAEIRRQRDELETLNRISETVYRVIQAVVDAADRAEIAAVVSERLAASELYRAVWVGWNNATETVEPIAGVGTVDDFLESIEALNHLEWDRPAAIAVESGELQVVQRISESDLPSEAKKTAAEMGIESGAGVPIVHDGRVLGVLCVYSSRSDAFSGREREAFCRLGEVVGFAINAVRTERLLLSDGATELTFRIEDDAAFLATTSSVAEGPCRLEWSAPAGGDRYRHYLSVPSADPEAVVEVVSETARIEQIDHVGTNGDHEVFEVLSSNSLTGRILDIGAAPTSIVATEGVTTVVAEVPNEADVRRVVEAAAELYDAELVSKRTVEQSVRTADRFRDAVASDLTDRQQDALRHAFFGGYFSWPRDATAEEVAETMGISSATFHYHIRRAERTLVESYLDHLDG